MEYPTGNEFILEEKVFEPYNTLKIEFKARRNLNEVFESSVTIISLIEMDIPDLTINVPDNYLATQKININDDLLI